MVGKPNNVQQI